MGKSCVKFHKKAQHSLHFSSFFFKFFTFLQQCIFLGNHSCKESKGRVRKYFLIGIFTKISVTFLKTSQSEQINIF